MTRLALQETDAEREDPLAAPSRRSAQESSPAESAVGDPEETDPPIDSFKLEWMKRGSERS